MSFPSTFHTNSPHDEIQSLLRRVGQCGATESSPSTCTPFSEPQSSQVIRREVSLILAANPPMQFIPFLKASILRCGNHTSSPSSSKSFVNFPDLFSPASIIQNLLLPSTSRKNRCSWVHLGTAAVWTPGPHQLSPPLHSPSPPSRCHLCFMCS